MVGSESAVHRGFLKYICGGKNVCLNLGIFSSIYDLIISNQVYTTAHMYDFKVQSNLRQATIKFKTYFDFSNRRLPTAEPKRCRTRMHEPSAPPPTQQQTTNKWMVAQNRSNCTLIFINLWMFTFCHDLGYIHILCPLNYSSD